MWEHTGGDHLVPASQHCVDLVAAEQLGDCECRIVLEPSREIFSEAFAGREHELPGDIESLAYLYVRLRESILYADIMSGRQPDPDVAERAVRALLTAG